MDGTEIEMRGEDSDNTMQEYDDEEIEESSRIQAEREQEREQETEQRQEPSGPSRAQHDRPKSQSDSRKREPSREHRQEVLRKHVAGYGAPSGYWERNPDEPRPVASVAQRTIETGFIAFSSDRGELTPDGVRDYLMKEYPAEGIEDEGSGKYTLN